MTRSLLQTGGLVYLSLLCLACLGLNLPASAQSQSSALASAARYSQPVQRYGHFALGRPHEYARLVLTAGTDTEWTFDLPDDEVFEDRIPQPVQLAAREPMQWLTVVSSRTGGARLVLFALVNDRLVVTAQSQAIGTPYRWLNPVGVADLDGDGVAEITAVITPHIGGVLKAYRQSGDQLVELAASAGFSNHVNGSAQQALAMPYRLAGRTVLLVPDQSRRRLMVVALSGNQWQVQATCALPAAAVGPLRVVSAQQVVMGLSDGQQHRLSPADCPPARSP